MAPKSKSKDPILAPVRHAYHHTDCRLRCAGSRRTRLACSVLAPPPGGRLPPPHGFPSPPPPPSWKSRKQPGKNRELATSVNIISIQESKHCDGISTDIGDACTNQTLIGDTDFRVKSRSAVEHGTGGGQGGSKGGEGTLGGGSRGERRKTSGWNTKGDAVRWGWSDFRREVAAHTSGTAREGLFLRAKKAEADSIMNSHVVDRTRGHPIETFGVQARPPRLAWPLLYNQKQYFRRFPRGRCGRSLARLEGSSPRDRVVWVHGGLD